MGFELDLIGQIWPSSASDLLSCPAKAARKRGQGERAPITVSAAIGNAAHDLTAQVHSGDFDAAPDAEIDSLIQRGWEVAVGSQRAELEVRAGAGRVPPPQRWRGYRIAEASLTIFLANEVRRRKSGEAAQVVAVEEWLESHDGLFGGRVDLVTRDHSGDHIIDLKSGALPDEGLSQSHLDQLSLYAYLWDESTGVFPQDVAVQHIDGSLRVQPLDRSHVERLCQELTAARDRVNRAIGRQASSDELANPSERICRWCTARATCEPFWGAIVDGWTTHRACLRGTVVAVEVAGHATSLVIRVQDSNLSGSPETVRVIGAPVDSVREGTQITILDLAPMSLPGHARWSEGSTLV